MTANRRAPGRLGLVWSALAGGAGALLLMACSAAAQPAAPGVRVAGARDVLPLAESLQAEFAQGTGLALYPITSTNSLADLKAGRADVAVVGRELSPDELQGLEEHVVAYDAVCLLINARTYAGGVQQSDTTPIQLEARYAGLPGLALDDVKGFVSNLLHLSKQTWQLHGPVAGSFTYQLYQDLNGQPEIDPDQPDHYLGTWVWADVTLGGEMLPAGKFDTQVALLQKLGYSESALNNPSVGLAPNILDSEEELISFRFRVDPQAARPISSRPFDFFVAIDSRRIALRAIQHGFDVQVLAVDGINPLGDPNLIYSGVYPLSRKIHLLTRQPAPPAARALVQFLLSPAGQLLIARASYLPLPPGQAGS